VDPVDKTAFNSPLWFLNVIFCVLLIYYIICFFFKNENQKGLVVLLLTIFGFLFAIYDIKLFLDFDLTLVSMSFLHLGFLFKNRYKEMQLKTAMISISIAVLIYFIGLYFSIQLGANGAYLSRLYKYSFVLFYFTAISGIIIVMSFSKIFVKIPIVNYLGRNSMIVLCVHFPLVQHLNVYVSTLELYNKGGFQGKIILGLVVYCITILFSVLCIEFFRRYTPKLTGFLPIFKI
jgi:acyltransferase